MVYEHSVKVILQTNKAKSKRRKNKFKKDIATFEYGRGMCEKGGKETDGLN